MADRQDPVAAPRPGRPADPSPGTPRRPRVTPLDPPVVPFALAGTGLWAVTGLVLLLTRAPSGWLWTCLAGVLIGFGLTGVGWLRDRRKGRHTGAYDRSRPPAGGTSTSSTSVSS